MRILPTIVFAALLGQVHAATFTVTVTNATGPGSLLEAIVQANTNPGPDRIEFAIPGSGLQVIAPTSALPTITEAVTVDGFTQPGARPNTLSNAVDAIWRIQLDGRWAGPASGLFFVGCTGAVVRGLAITRFAGEGLGLTANCANCVVEGIAVGLDPAGNARPNTGAGIRIMDSRECLIGGNVPAARNVVSGNSGSGIALDGVQCISNRIQGNLIGLDPSGRQVRPNGGNGVSVIWCPANLIGGDGPGEGNVISGNWQCGVYVYSFLDFGGPLPLHRVQGNWIGTDASGERALGNLQHGILLIGAGLIGGTTPHAGNVIAGNGGDGIQAWGFGRPGSPEPLVTIQGNRIGVGQVGRQPLGNTGNGIKVASGKALVGGEDLSAANQIAFNGQAGVYQSDWEPTAVLGNAIFENGSLGIRSFSNASLQINAVLDHGTNVWIAGQLTGAPNQPYHVEFFWNPAADPSGQGEGEVLLLATNLLTHPLGVAEFAWTWPESLPQLSCLAGTVTDATGQTSPFSLCHPIVAPDMVDLIVQVWPPSNAVSLQSHLAFSVTVSNRGPGTATQVTLTNHLPERAGLVSTSVSQGSCQLDGLVLRCDLGTLASGGGATVSFALQPEATGAYSVTSEAWASQVDYVPGNNQRVAAQHAGVADLASYAVYAHTGTDVAGQTVTFDVVVTNRGPDKATDCRLYLGPWEIPPFRGDGLSVVNPHGSVSYQGPRATCHLGDIQAGASARVTVSYLLVETGDYYLTGEAFATETDPYPTDNRTHTHRRAAAGAGVLGLESPSIVVTETDGIASIRVVRWGGTAGLVSVAYATQDGTARAGTNYFPVSGFLVFTNGQSAGTIRVPVLRAPLVTSNLWFTLELEPTTGGAALTTASNATVHLLEADFTVAGEILGVSVMDTNLVPAGGMANQNSANPVVSADGRYVFFTSQATNLVPGMGWPVEPHVFRRDLWHQQTEWVSRAVGDWGPGRYEYYLQSITPDGRWAAFVMVAYNNPSAPSEPAWQLFVRDMDYGVTQLASVNQSNTGPGNGQSSIALLSACGRYVLFASAASDLVADDDNDAADIFLRDLEQGTTQRISVDTNGQSYLKTHEYVHMYPCGWISNRWVVFTSNADGLAPHDTNGPAYLDVLVRDVVAGTTRLVSVNQAGTASRGTLTFCHGISADGRFVLLQSNAPDLVPNDGNGQTDIFLRDLWLEQTLLVSVNPNGGAANGASMRPSMSADGRYVVFTSAATDLGPLPLSFTTSQVYLRDMWAGTTRWVSGDRYNVWGHATYSDTASISADGRKIFFHRTGTFMPTGGVDLGGIQILVHDREDASTTLISRSLSGQGAWNFDSFLGGISADGRVAAFHSDAPNFVPGDHFVDYGWPTGADVFVWRADDAANVVDLVLTLQAATNPVPITGTIELTAAVLNVGSNAAPGVVGRLVTPAGWTWTEVQASQGTWSNTGGVVYFDLGQLSPGSRATASLRGGSDTGGMFSVTASCHALAPEHTPNNNVSQMAVFVADEHTDADGDGMSDMWEWQHGLAPLQGTEPWDDTDGDGLSTLFEFLSGTDPTAASSTLRLTGIHWEGEDVVIGFATAVGKVYWLERNTNFPVGTWEPVGQPISGTGLPVTVRDAGTGVEACTTIYRVRLAG